MEIVARNTMSELTQMNRLATAGELSASIAHEVSQPLTGIVMRANAALRAVQVSIEESGIGIGPSDLDRIFKPMFTTKAGGMGLGLSICHSIVENHNGWIWTTAGSERGSIFRFALPTGGACN
jgi:signal transduction histidine kinase